MQATLRKVHIKIHQTHFIERIFLPWSTFPQGIETYFDDIINTVQNNVLSFFFLSHDLLKLGSLVLSQMDICSDSKLYVEQMAYVHCFFSSAFLGWEGQ